MSKGPVSSTGASLENGRPIVFRHGLVLTMNNATEVLHDADVLVVDGVISAVGPRLEAPNDALEIDARGGIIMPGMIDTHRHMWQTAMRGYGADWTLSQYFVWYYLQHGKTFRPQDIYAGNLLSAIEAIDAGVTTTVDWSHGLQTVEHADAAVDALEEVPGRFVLAYGNIQAGPWEWSASPEFRDFHRRRIDGRGDMLGFQMAFDVTGDPEFPEKAAFEVARELGVPVTTHAGVWGATGDDSIRLMHEHGFMNSDTIYVHASPRPVGPRRCRPRVRRAPARATLRRGSCVSTTYRCRCPWTPACGSAAISSPRCARPWVRTGYANTSRPRTRLRPSPTYNCVARKW